MLLKLKVGEQSIIREDCDNPEKTMEESGHTVGEQSIIREDCDIIRNRHRSPRPV